MANNFQTYLSGLLGLEQGWQKNFKLGTHTQYTSKPLQKSVNLQYNTLGCLDNGTSESWTKHLMFQVLFFFHDFLQNLLQKSFQSIYSFFYNLTKKLRVLSALSPSQRITILTQVLLILGRPYSHPSTVHPKICKTLFSP